MARAASASDPVVSAYLTLRRARRGSPDALAAGLERAQQQLEEAFVGRTTSKAEAAGRLGVSAQTVDTWVEQGLLPTVKDPRYARERVPLKLLMALVAEVEELRQQGRKRGLLIEALSRLELADEVWQKEMGPLLERAGEPLDRSQYVAAQRDGWHPED
jgi:transposase